MLGMIFTVLIGLLAVGGVVLAVVVKIKNRGKGCCGGCSGCGAASAMVADMQKRAAAESHR